MLLCAITGTIYDEFGVALPNYSFRLLRVEKNGEAIALKKEFVTSDGSGNVAFTLPRGASAFIKGKLAGIETPDSGVEITVPDAASAVLGDLWPPVQGDPPESFVFSFNTRTGAVTLTSADVINALGYTPADATSSLVGASYIHTQNSPATVWTITHNLNSYPSVTVIDSAGTVVFGGVEYLTANQIRLTFSAAFSGRAVLN